MVCGCLLWVILSLYIWWACDNYYKKNVKLTVLKLERAYHKAISEGLVGKKKTSKVSIPLMITNKMRFQLSMLGYYRQEMKHLTPEQCWGIINKGVPKKPSRERGRNQWLTLKTRVIVWKFCLPFSFFLLSMFSLFIHFSLIKALLNCEAFLFRI